MVRNGRTVWSEGTFSIPRGAVVGVIGPNGSGKTTLLEMVLGLLPPASGRMTVLGQPPRRGDPASATSRRATRRRSARPSGAAISSPWG